MIKTGLVQVNSDCRLGLLCVYIAVVVILPSGDQIIGSECSLTLSSQAFLLGVWNCLCCLICHKSSEYKELVVLALLNSSLSVVVMLMCLW